MNKDIIDCIKAINDAELIGERVKGIDDSENHPTYSNEIFDVINKFSNENELLKSLKEVDSYRLNKKRNIEKLIASTTAAKKKKSNNNRYLLKIGSVAAILTALSLTFYFNYDNTIETVNKTNEYYELKALNIAEPILVLNSGEKINLISKNNESNYTLMKESAHSDSEELGYNTLIVPSEYIYTVILSDSSKITINANSELRYPVNFTGETREVFLKGEAYFEIAKGAKRFVVNNLGVKIEVYGTEFNVNTIDNNIVETVLVSGSLGVKNENDKNTTLLTPNQKSTFNKQDMSNTISNICPGDYLSWMTDYFVFNDKKLVKVVGELGKWYGIDLKFRNKEDKEIVITGSFSKNTPLDKILATIGKTIEPSFIKENNIYVIE